MLTSSPHEPDLGHLSFGFGTKLLPIYNKAHIPPIIQWSIVSGFEELLLAQCNM